MKSKITVNGKPAVFNSCFLIVPEEIGSNAAEKFDKIEICAWCTPPTVTTQLCAAGFNNITHGICDACAVKMKEEVLAFVARKN